MITEKEIDILKFDCCIVDKEGNKTELGTAIKTEKIEPTSNKVIINGHGYELIESKTN